MDLAHDNSNQIRMTEHLVTHPEELMPDPEELEIFLTETHFKPLKQGWSLFKASVPNVGQSFGVFVLYFSSMIAANATKDNQLVAGFGLGISIYHALQYSLILSLNNGLFTQASHAFGAKNYRLAGILLQRAWAIDVFILILTIPLVLSIKSFLMYLEVDPQIAETAQNYILFILPGTICTLLFDTLKCFLMAQQEFHTPMVIQNVSYGFAPLYLYIFVGYFDLALVGICISRVLCEMTGAVLIYRNIISDIKKKGEESQFIGSWIPWDREALNLKDCIEYLKVSTSIGAVIYLEWCLFEIQTFIVASLGNEDALAAHGSFVGILLFFYMTPLGLSFSVNSFLGNLIGEGKTKVARNFVKVIFFVTGTFAVTFVIISQFLKPWFVSHFTTNPHMEHYFGNIYTIYTCTYFFVDAFMIISATCLRCLGQQNFATGGFIVIYYGFGLPLTFFMVFTMDLGVYGVWYSLFVMATTVDIVFLRKIYKLDFQVCSDKIRDEIKLKNNNNPNEEVELTEL